MKSDLIVKEYFNNRVKLIIPKLYKDKRGYFLESFNKKKIAKIISSTEFVQDNISYSINKFTIRGIHFQKPPHNQSKIITVLDGEILDVVLDINPKSKHFGKYKLFKLNSENNKYLYISDDFAHGFCTLRKNTKVLYKVSKYYNPQSEKTILWSDSKIKIKFPKSKKYFLSPKDKIGHKFETLQKTFKLFQK